MNKCSSEGPEPRCGFVDPPYNRERYQANIAHVEMLKNCGSIAEIDELETHLFACSKITNYDRIKIMNVADPIKMIINEGGDIFRVETLIMKLQRRARIGFAC